MVPRPSASGAAVEICPPTTTPVAHEITCHVGTLLLHARFLIQRAHRRNVDALGFFQETVTHPEPR